MKVSELITLLQGFDQDALVVMSSDGEGNSHSPLSGLWFGAYRAENTWSGEVGYRSLTPDLVEAGFGEEDVIDDGVPAVILSPVN